jgi:hypothetical protein
MTSNNDHPIELVSRAQPKIETSIELKTWTSPIAHGRHNDKASDDTRGSIDATDSRSRDAQDMRRMGHEQQLNRTFRQASIASFVTLATASWEIGIFAISPALTNGGRAGLVWSLLWNWVGFLPIYLSMVCHKQHRYLRVLHLSKEISEPGWGSPITLYKLTLSSKTRQRWLVSPRLLVLNTIGSPSLHLTAARNS